MQMFDHSQIEFNVDTFNIPDVPEELGKVLKRTDTGQPLAIVSKDYTPVQYIDIVQNIEEALTIASQDESTKLDLTVRT